MEGGQEDGCFRLAKKFLGSFGVYTLSFEICILNCELYAVKFKKRETVWFSVRRSLKSARESESNGAVDWKFSSSIRGSLIAATVEGYHRLERREIKFKKVRESLIIISSAEYFVL